MNTGSRSRGGKKGATSVCYIVPERFGCNASSRIEEEEEKEEEEEVEGN